MRKKDIPQTNQQSQKTSPNNNGRMDRKGPLVERVRIRSNISDYFVTTLYSR